MNQKFRENWSWWLRWMTLAVAVIVVWKTFDNLGGIFSSIGWILSLLTPFIIGFVFAYFLNKPHKRLYAKMSRSKRHIIVKHARAFSTLVVYLGFLLLLAVLLSFLLPALVNSVISFVDKVPQYQDNLVSIVENLSKNSPLIASLELDEAIKNFSLTDLSGIIKFENVGTYFEGIVSVSSVVTSIFLGIIISIYMILDKENLIKVIKRLLGLVFTEERIYRMAVTLRRVDQVIYRYFFAQLTDSLIVSTVAALGLTLIGVPNAPVLGFFYGMFNFIPYFGPIIAIISVPLLTFISSDFLTTLWAFIFLFLLQQVDANFLNPRILGSSLGFSPFWVIFAVTLGSGLFGITGMILGVPIFAAIRLFVIDFVRAREAKKARADSKSEKQRE